MQAGLPQKPTQSKKVGAWQRFVEAKRTGTKRSFADLGRDWAEVSMAARQRYAAPAPAAGQAQAAPAPATPPDPVAAPVGATAPAAPAAPTSPARCRSVWPHVGDDYYPIRIDKMGDVPRRIGALCSQWRKHIGNSAPQGKHTNLHTLFSTRRR